MNSSSVNPPNRVKHGLDAAGHAVNSPLLLRSASDLARAAKAWRSVSYLGLDTEFLRERTYYAELGLIQVSDGTTVWLIDPLAVKDLSPVSAMMEDASVTKLFHSPSEDFEIIRQALSAIPEPVIDTQMACALLGQPLQLAYHAAVKWLLGIEIANDQTRSNWIARPLSRAQMIYAAQDVAYLPAMWEVLQIRLERAGRLTWLLEDCDQLAHRNTLSRRNSEAWMRVRGIGRLNSKQLVLLRDLYFWREETAKNRNLPRGFVLKDPVLMALTLKAPCSLAALESIDGLGARTIARYGVELIQLIEGSIRSEERLEPLRPLNRAQKQRLAILRERVRKKADELGIESALLATKRELEAIARSVQWEDFEGISGWRQSLLR